MLKRRWFVIGGVAAVLARVLPALALPVRINRYLDVRSAQGQVFNLNGGRLRVGDRLSQVGQGVVTQQGSASLAVDTQVGFVNISPQTRLRLTRIETTSSGGRVTHFAVDRGQARLQVRPFTNPSSELEIRTPAAVSGVRGTVFGVSVQDSGLSAIAVTEGAVETSAQGRTVQIGAGYQSLVVPGMPPSEPVPIVADPILDIDLVAPETSRIAPVTLRTTPGNQLLIDGEPVDLGASGRLRLMLAAGTKVTVITPLGTNREYEIAF